jgi:hypothetical protein
MATFDKLIEDRKLFPVIIRLPHGQFHERKIYAYPECLEWMRKEIPKMITGRVASASTPKEQFIERMRQWMSGDPMAYGRMFHDMSPTSDNVWEIKTADLRIFGWMYRPRKFIAVRGGYADDYKEPTKIKTYADERRKVVKARGGLPLDGNKYAEGKFDELV